jgi:hypothetical protein
MVTFQIVFVQRTFLGVVALSQKVPFSYIVSVFPSALAYIKRGCHGTDFLEM